MKRISVVVTGTKSASANRSLRGFLKSSLCALWSEQSQTSIRDMLYHLVILRALCDFVVNLTTKSQRTQRSHEATETSAIRDFCNPRLLRKPLRLLTLPLLPGLIAIGCIPEEDPIAPFDRGGVSDVVVGMGSDYNTRLYFDLGTGTVVKQGKITDWDLGFLCDEGEYRIVLNGAQIMSAADAGLQEFEAVTSLSGLEWKYDHPSGNSDSTAIGIWWRGEGKSVDSRGHVYVVDRGYDAAGTSLGFVKIVLLGADATGWYVRFALLDNSMDRTVMIRRDPSRNLVGLSFTSGEPVEVEPPKDQWDILFTRYTHLFYDPEFTPYSVTGVLLNRYNTTAAVDSVRSFDEVTVETVTSLDYSSRLDGVGYDWKFYDFTEGYIIRSPVYVIRDAEGFTYKLVFTDFYNGEGEKGYPAFRLQRL